ncbi:hypothetical protein [Winogradskyella algicola]|uniref:hypothetical protein n=1 Tax=Winogradskyella algicola TaxID=2575815 RepID=UPI001109ADF0|nr:hypothetical protein [Winogradskyella algicola]
MNQEAPKSPQNEEVDLIQIFKYFGKFLDRIYNFFKSIFKGFLSIIIQIIKAIIDNYKIVFGSMLIAAVIGYGLEKTKEDVYLSKMLVKPYFDSKFQLVANIDFYNALIADKDYSQLQRIFNISESDAEKIIDFEIHPGPENENDQIAQYDKFLKSIDSLRAQEVSFENFIENRSIYSGDIFEISVKSHKKDIFRSLEVGLNSTFSNAYSAKKMKKRDSILKIEKNRILASLEEVDSLKKVYIGIKKEESKSDRKSFSTQDGFTYIEQRTETKEYELIEKQIKLQQDLSALETQKVEEDEFFDTLSSFPEVGAKYVDLSERYSIIFPILIFIFLSILYLAKKIIRYVKSYEV